MDEEETYDVRFKAPFTAIVSGPTGSGKTVLLQQLIENAETVCDKPPVKIYYRYGAWQKAFENPISPILEYGEGMMDIENDVPDDGQHRWIIVDDLLGEVGGKAEMNNLFTKHSHHKNLSVFFVTQNLFDKNIRLLSVNAQYVIVFKNPRDMAQIAHLGRQIFPQNPKFLTESYVDATKEPYSYLLLDLKQSTREEVRVLGGFSSEGPIAVYDWR